VILPLLVVPYFKCTVPSVINYYLLAGWRLRKATVSSLSNLSTRVLQVDTKPVVMSAWNIQDIIGLPIDTLCSLNLERKVRIQRTDGNWLKKFSAEKPILLYTYCTERLIGSLTSEIRNSAFFSSFLTLGTNFQLEVRYL